MVAAIAYHKPTRTPGPDPEGHRRFAEPPLAGERGGFGDETPHQADDRGDRPELSIEVDAAGNRRLNVLLTDRGEDWAAQLPELLEPQGVRSFRVANAGEAVELIEATPIHVAVLDMYLDGDPESPPRAERLPGGLKLLRVMQRIDQRPPAVMVVRNRYFDPRIDNFVLAEALKLNAFSVLDQPVHLEQLLAVLRRAIERYFGGHWPQR